MFAANVKDSELAEAENNPFVAKVREYAAEHHGCETVVISAQIESELIDLSDEEAGEFLSEMGVKESGVGQLIQKSYSLLGLQTYFTTGEKRRARGQSARATPPPRRPASFTAILSVASSKPRRSPTRI